MCHLSRSAPSSLGPQTLQRLMPQHVIQSLIALSSSSPPPPACNSTRGVVAYKSGSFSRYARTMLALHPSRYLTKRRVRVDYEDEGKNGPNSNVLEGERPDLQPRGSAVGHLTHIHVRAQQQAISSFSHLGATCRLLHLAFILYNTSMVYLAAYKAVDLILIPAMPGALYLAQHSLHDDVVGHIPSDCNLPGPDWLSKYRASPAETA